MECGRGDAERQERTRIQGEISMNDGNKELIEEMMIAVFAKDKLEKVEKLVEQEKGATIKKSDLQKILQEEEGDFPE